MRRSAPLLAAAVLLAAGVVWADETLERKPLDVEGLKELKKAQQGKVLALSFFATWCDPCREEFPDILRLRAEFKDRPFYLAIVSVDNPKTWDENVVPFLREHQVNFPVYNETEDDDEKFINAVDPEWFGSLPAFFIYDGQGKLRRSYAEKQTFETLRDAIREELNRLQPATGG